MPRPTIMMFGLLSILVIAPLAVSAQDGAPVERKRLEAVRVPNGAIHTDGRIDEPAWQSCTMVSDFTQKEPKEGITPRERTEVGFVYDDDALYVGARMWSDSPESLRVDLNRRDNPGNSEQMIISLDTYFDHRTCWDFGVSVAGVRTDRFHPSDDEYDRELSFNPVWSAHSDINDSGWTCEMRIPFSQLRFIDKDQQVWGVNLNRWIPGRNEDNFWVAVPRSETGWSSWFGELHGISGITPPRRLELLPYVAGDASFESSHPKEDPFSDGSEFAGRAGTDLKMGLGPNLTLDATINPDFGQVEADPAEVNLTDFETAFDEKRPFFIEGGDLFEAEGPSYFYSRRIGTRPRGPAGGDYVDYPHNSTIIGAAKVTGRTSGGLSVGAISALTAREWARTYDVASDTKSSVEVQPVTGYGVIRMQQEFGEDQSTAGILLTGVKRDLSDDDPLAEISRTSSVAGGADWKLRFKGGAYDIVGQAGFSHVAGTETAIMRTQLSSARYFQRPDAAYVELDPAARSLSGYTVGLRGGKRAGRHWLWGGGFSMVSPGFEVNDAGILRHADRIEGWNHVLYREQTPGKLFHRYEVVLSQNSFWNFAAVKGPADDPSHLLTFAELNLDATFRNFWGAHYYFGYDFRGRSHEPTRGGPMMATSPGIFTNASVRSNFTKPITFEAEMFYHQDEIGGWEHNGEVSFGGRIGHRLSLSVQPGFERAVRPRQYVAALPHGPAATYGNRYVFARLFQTVLAAEIRLNYFFTPDLSLECYAEPFVASGEYTEFGQLPRPATLDLDRYGQNGTAVADSGDGHYYVTGTLGSFDFFAEDFGYRSYRSNVVMRWEFRPGSTLFLVWQQNREGDRSPGRRVGLRSLREVFEVDGANFVALKLSYWIPAT